MRVDIWGPTIPPDETHSSMKYGTGVLLRRSYPYDPDDPRIDIRLEDRDIKMDSLPELFTIKQVDSHSVLYNAHPLYLTKHE
jgi:hypothetical protein